MLGAKKTCPECTMDVRWINTWHDPVKEKDAAASLFDAGADVVLTGADTPAVAQAAKDKGKWGVTYDYFGSCQLDSCLTTIYWLWGPAYAAIAEKVKAKTYTAGYEYFDAETGGRKILDARLRRPDGQGHPGQDAGGPVHPLRRLRRPDHG